MSDSEEDAAGAARQKSIFSGMGRVKQINHLREKWSPKPKAAPGRAFDAAPSPSWMRPASADKFQTQEGGRKSVQRTQSVSSSPKRQTVLSVVDLERYLAINTWLEHNGIDVSRTEKENGSPGGAGLLDEMYSSLEMMETEVESELGTLGKAGNIEESVGGDPSALIDYLAIIGADMLDVVIRNYWNRRENVFEATVAFAHPPESQFNAESLEHFCFPIGVKIAHFDDRRKDAFSGSASNVSGGEDFFVLMLTGGGIQGQSVQYAMCMKGVITLREGSGVLKMPLCYCIIAQTPFIPFFKGVLHGLLDNLRSELESSECGDCSSLSNIVTNKHVSYVDEMLQKIKQIVVPDKGCTSTIDLFNTTGSELALTRLHEENDADEKAGLLLQWSLSSLLAHLSIDRVLQILGFLLVEMKVIVVCGEIPLLSSTTLGLASLLHPLTWAGPLISVLPPFMHEYMEAPVPLICGVDQLPRNFEISKGTCIIYLEESRVQLHPEDERLFSKVEMPGWTSLSCDLTRFTKEMLGRAESFSRDKIMPLSIHLVIHRMRRHIEYLLRLCSHAGNPFQEVDLNQRLDSSEMRFIDGVMQTQMYQKYRDDLPVATVTEQSRQQVQNVQVLNDKIPTEDTISRKPQDGLKEAASVLFQIALAGVSRPPLQTGQLDEPGNNDANQDSPLRDAKLLPSINKPNNGDVAETGPTSYSPSPTPTSPPTPTPTARSAGSANNSPKEIADFPLEAHATSQDEIERSHDRIYEWPIGHSGLDLFWLNEHSSPDKVSPPSSIMEKTSPCRSTTNNESEFGGGDGMKSVTRSEHESLSYPPRDDTETTISVFDVALSEITGNADTDDMWMFEPPDELLSEAYHQEDTDERTSLHESSEVEDNTPRKETEGAMIKEGQSLCDSGSPLWKRGLEDKVHDVSENKSCLTSHDMLPPDRAKMLMTGINVDARGAWDGWREGRLFTSTDFTVLTWERHNVAFAALNMNIADITGIAIEESRITIPDRHEERRIQLHFGGEAIYFQYVHTPRHDDFFRALKELVHPAQVLTIDRQESFESSPTLVEAPHLLTQRHDSFENLSDHSSDDCIPARIQPAPKETDFDHFKARFQRGFLVEKHGRLGKPHPKLIYTDALCSHIMWRKPSATDSGDKQKQVIDIGLVPQRSSFFAPNKNIPVESITAIVTGKQTSVFRRASATKTNERLCLSILTPTRTLDVCAHSLQVYQELYRGLSLLLEEVTRTRSEMD